MFSLLIIDKHLALDIDVVDWRIGITYNRTAAIVYFHPLPMMRFVIWLPRKEFKF